MVITGIAGAVILAALLSAFYLQGLRGGGEIPELTIHLDQDKCHRCGMLISDVRFTAAMLVRGEQDFRKYDDVGCLLEEYKKIDKNDVLAVIVHDYFSNKPLKAEKAWYVVAPKGKLATPMGYGVVALASYEEAQRLAEEYGGEVLDWEGLVRNINMIIGGGDLGV